MIRLTGWNRAATRFIDPPSFEWEPVPGARGYCVRWQAGPHTGVIEATGPGWNCSRIWHRIPVGAVTWTVESAPGTEAGVFSFVRMPDCDDRAEVPLDWKASALRNLDWLLGLPADPDTGEPWWLTHSWHGHPADLVIAYPALHYPSFVELFLAAQRVCDPLRAAKCEAALAATAAAIMRWRTGPEGVAPLMPVTTRITRNPGPPRAEEGTVTVFRAARMGEALLRLYGWRRQREWLAYAEHIGEILARLQRPDGSWAYRIRPADGTVVEAYTSAGITTVAFFEALMRVTGSRGYDAVVQRAVDWTLANPCRTNRWQGMYEDVGSQDPYANLENWDALDAIHRFCGRPGASPAFVASAVALNRWVEDQFVVFGEAAGVPRTRIHAPAVIEQYICAYPMEVHTARWIGALRSLEAATGDRTYGRKATRAANAIVRAQFPEGRFSTWGRDAVTGQPLNDEGDWYGCNAIAATALLEMTPA